MASSTSGKDAPGKEKAGPQPLGNTGTHIPAPNTYLLSQLTRANYLTARRYPFTDSPDAFATELQRHVHYEGKRPPNRRILLFLRLLTFYPPVPDILPELIILLESENHHVCRLAHYHIRQIAPIRDADSYRSLIGALERQATSPCPARRACATKTMAKVFLRGDTAPATDFVMDVFNRIGGARVCKPVPPSQQNRAVGQSQLDDTSNNNKKPSNMQKIKEKGMVAFTPTKIVRGEVYDHKAAAAANESGDNASNNNSKGSSNRNLLRRKSAAAQLDDGAGGVIQSPAARTGFIKSRNGKMLVVHSAVAALRRINRVATDRARVESYIFDSGLMSLVPSTVRHTMALLELRSTVSPKAVSQYLAPRLPHRGPPPNMRLQLEELGARVYFARLLSALAEDPNLSQYIPDEAPKQAKRDQNNSRNKASVSVMDGGSVREKATQLFKFLFSREQVSNVISTVRERTSNALSIARPPRGLKYEDSLGVEYAEALINLVKNASNRVLIEALRGLSRRKWTTWFEAPIPQSALYNAPELREADGYDEGEDAWDNDDDESKDEDGDSEDESELGAFEDDLAQGGGQDGAASGEQEKRPSSAREDGVEPDALTDRRDTTEKDTLFSRMRLRRKERRENRIESKTPFYLRGAREGMVPALEIILRRINAGLLEDEPVRRFAAVDAVIVLSRAKIYGHTKEEHGMLRKAQSAVQRLQIEGGGSSLALITAGDGAGSSAMMPGGAFGDEQTHPLEALVRPLTELINEDPNTFIRGRAAVALLFVVASGAGRGKLEVEAQNVDDDEPMISFDTPILLRLLGGYIRHPASGSGNGLKQMSEVVDYLVYEILDVAPDLASSALALVEEWARVHPTVGVCGRLGAIWEKVLSLGLGKLVGESLIRSITAGPSLERVASAATIFLRRRTLDVAVMTVGAEQLGIDRTGAGVGLPEPLPRAVGVEMERYFSVLWHCILVGPSAECRAFAVESLGGAAVLAGEPFRISTYERLVELVRVGGFGVRPIAERVLTSLDALYVSREQFSETRAKYRIPRDGSYTGKEWLSAVWKLRCEALNAAQIAIGVTPPPGWMALGTGAAKDVANAERAFLGLGGAPNLSGASASASNSNAAAANQTTDIDQNAGSTSAPGNGMGIDSDIPMMGFNAVVPVGYNNRPENEDILNSRGLSSARRDQQYGRYDYGRNDEQRGDQYYDRRDDEGDGYRRREYYDEQQYDHRDDRYGNYENRDEERRQYQEVYDDPYDENGREEYVKDPVEEAKQKQEEEDRKLAEQLQQEDQAASSVDVRQRQAGIGLGSEARDMLSSTAQAAERLFRQGMRGGKDLTDKVRKTAARSAALDKLNNIPK